MTGHHERVLIIGFGEVGKSLYQIVREIYPKTQWLDIKPKEIEKPVDIVHICYPCIDTEVFIEDTIKYIGHFNPELTIVESTVTPGSTNKIYEKVKRKLVHSPVRGMHQNMKEGLLKYIKFIGPVNKKSARLAEEHLQSLGMKTYTCSSPLETEFAKIFNTTYRALMISWFQEMLRICWKHKADYQQVVRFIETTGDRPVMYPGFIGGHCLIPNCLLLKEVWESKFIDAILESNEKRRFELEKSGELHRDSEK